MPHFQEVYDAKAGQFELVAIAHPTSEDASGFVEKSGYTFTFGMPDDAKAAFGGYKVDGIPVTVFIDRQGNIKEQIVGGMDKATFEEKLNQIL